MTEISNWRMICNARFRFQNWEINSRSPVYSYDNLFWQTTFRQLVPVIFRWLILISATFRLFIPMTFSNDFLVYYVITARSLNSYLLKLAKQTCYMNNLVKTIRIKLNSYNMYHMINIICNSYTHFFIQWAFQNGEFFCQGMFLRFKKYCPM